MGRTVLVTGGTGALGTTVVGKFLKNGDTVLVTDIREASPDYLAQFSEHSDKLKTFVVNVVKEAELKKLAGEIKELHNGLDILVNIVGGFSMTKISETEESEFDNMININLRSAFLSAKTFLPQLTAKNHGRIINISARAGLHGIGGMGPYCISKAGVLSLTQTIADEIKETTATANAILPSVIDTVANRKDMPDADFSKWVSPDDIAGVIFFLASEAGRAVNGASIPVYNKA